MVKKLSVFFPAYNEEGNIENTVNKAISVLEKLNLEYEVMVIDDGSTDNTGKIADDLAARIPQIRVIHHSKNLGYGEALKSGFYNAKYDTIVYTDGDGQFDFSEMTKFLEKIEDYDLILGYRIKRQDPFFRILFKKGWKLSLLIFFGLTLKDVDCGFKMIRKTVLETIPHLESTRGAMINAELAIKAQRGGFKILQIGVNHYPRLSGKPTGANLRVIITSFMDLIKLWWKLKEQKPLFIMLVLILILAAFLRFYRLEEYMTFLGDEGRDAIIVKNIVEGRHFPLIGPPTSVGNIYLAPLYYYMMALSMTIFWLNPVGAVAMNALIGVMTVFLIYYLGRSWFGKAAGLIASYLYAISPVTIIYSRSSWNPNPTPFFALVAMLGFYKAHQTANFRWLILTGVASAAALQMHYLAVILLPIFAILWLYEVISQKKRQIKNLVSGTSLGILAFILVMSPLIWFDLRHDFLNYQAITQLLTQTDAVVVNPLNSILRVPTLFVQNLIGRYVTAEGESFTYIITLMVAMFLTYEVGRWIKEKKVNWSLLALLIWLSVGLLGLSFYTKEIYDHYLNFLNPTIFLLIGYSANFILKKKDGFRRWWSLVFITVLMIILTALNLERNPLNYPPNNQLKRTQEVAQFVIAQSGDKDFNFALLAKNNYDAAYQFFLDQYGHKPKQVPFEITEQLFVVCEDPVCEPINHPKYEIAAFGWAKIAQQHELAGVEIYKLIPNPSGKPQ